MRLAAAPLCCSLWWRRTRVPRKAQRADGEMALSLPRPIGAGETAFLEIEVGAIGRAHGIERRPRQAAPSAPLRRSVRAPARPPAARRCPSRPAICDGRVALRLTLREGVATRPPTTERCAV